MLEKMQVDRFLVFSKPSGAEPVNSHPENTTTTKNFIDNVFVCVATVCVLFCWLV